MKLPEDVVGVHVHCFEAAEFESDVELRCVM